MEYHVTLAEMLDARERRVFRQQELLTRYRLPMICFTMNIAGPVKNDPLIRKGFELGNRFLKEQLDSLKITPVYFTEFNEPSGNEAYYVIDADVLFIKEITCSIEDDYELGRLFDMDVLKPDGKKAERSDLDLPPRPCLICGGSGKDCARSRAHTVEQLRTKTAKILTRAVEDEDARLAAGLACRALLYEVCTTPKPGLVDREGNGSHKDMDIFTFMDSASALWPYFETCTRIGRQTADRPGLRTFDRIRFAGRKAETAMFSATGGVNTHKGAVFSMGILCGALGRLSREQWKDPDVILDTCAAMTKGLTDADFAGLTEENAVTTGQKLYLRYHITGVRGQMEKGLPAVRDAGLPVLKEGIARGLSVNDAGCGALLALMTAAVDTNLIARSSLKTQQETAAEIRQLLDREPYPDRENLRRLDREFVEKNLSPGGSADLLAVCYLLYFLETVHY